MSKRRSRADRSQRRPPAPRSAPREPAKHDAATAWPIAKSTDLLAHVAVPILFFAFVWSWHPFHDVFEFDPDEGNNVIKALMLAKGHALYAEIWSDQPPLFTYLLRGWFAVAGWTVHQGRLLVLLCSSVLLWAFYQTLRLTWGHAAAVAGAIMLAASFRYLALSVAVMLALPTLMFAMLSIYAVARYRSRPHPGWLAASGALLAMSLFTKLFTLLAAPLIGLAVLGTAWSHRSDPDRRGHWLKPVVLWCAGVAAAGAVLFVATVPLGEFAQLVKPHLDAEETFSAGRYEEGYDQEFWKMVKGENSDYGFALLGVLGLLQVLRRRAWFSLLPVTWSVLAYLSLWQHRPLWYHHYPLLGVPLCWTAGIAVGPVFTREFWRSCFPWRGLRSGFAMLIALSAMVLGGMAVASLPAKFEREREYASGYVEMTPSDEYTVAVMKQFRDRTNYVVTDRQMLAFSSGMIVPPELSVTSVKRMQSGHLTMENLIDLLEKYDPGVILLSFRSRIPVTRPLQEYLQEFYVQLYSLPRGRGYDRFYVRKDLADEPIRILETARAQMPDLWDGQYTLGVWLGTAGRHEEALGYLRSAVDKQPTADGYFRLGQSLAALGRTEAAIRAYETSALIFDRRNEPRAAARAKTEADRLRGRGDQE